jgi:hypothetical protein
VKMGFRSAVMSALNVVPEMMHKFKEGSPYKRIKTLGVCLRYAIERGRMCGKRSYPVDVPDLVNKWIEAIAGMCLAHSKDEYDAQDAKADDLLGPILTAPIKQVREFYAALKMAMEKDKRVPFMVQMGFEVWGQFEVKDAPDEGIKRLKRKLAADIAELVEEPIKDQIPGAIKRALMWRDAETLEAVKETLEKGVKPKLRGRESCLFLEMSRVGKPKVSVML